MMRILVLTFTLLIPGALMGAAGRHSLEWQVQRAAIDLFVSGNNAAALAHLRANVRSEAGPDGATIALTQSLIEIAAVLYNQRQIAAAREVVAQAFVAADPVVTGRSAALAARRAGILSSLGLLAENIALDLKRAETLYDAAAALNPRDKSYAERKRAVVAKQNAAGGRNGP